MAKTINFSDNSYIDFPDDTPDDKVEALSKDYARQQGLLDPSLGSLLQAGADSTLSTLANLPIAAIDKYKNLTDNTPTPLAPAEGQDTTPPVTPDDAHPELNNWRNIFEDVRAGGKESAAETQDLMMQPQDAGNAPGRFIKQQVGFQAPQMIGLMAASAVPGGQVIGPAAAYTYFTAANLERQRDEGQPYNLTKAAGFAGGQAATEALLQTALSNVPGSSFLPYMGKLFATGVGGQVAQQIMTRAAAGLDLTDHKAVNEYIDSAINGSVFVGVGGPITYITTHNGSLHPVSPEIKAKLDKGEQISPEEIVEEQARNTTGTVQLPDQSDPTKTVSLPIDDILKQSPDITDHADAILQGAGLDHTFWKTSEEKAKAASVVLRNTTDSEIMESKFNDLRDAGVDENTIRQYEQDKPKEFNTKPVEDVYGEIKGVSPEDALKALEPVKTKNNTIQTQAMTLAHSDVLPLDTTDADTNSITTTLDTANATRNLTDEFLKRSPKKINVNATTDTSIPEWLTKKSAEGVSRTLQIKQKDVKSTLANNVAKEGYLQPFTPEENAKADFVQNADLTGNIHNEILNGADPNEMLHAEQIIQPSDDNLNKTFNGFAQNEADLMNFKKTSDQIKEATAPQEQQAPIAPVRPETTILDRVKPLADKIDVLPATVPFIDNVVKNVTRTLNSRARGVGIDKVSNRIMNDPIYKVQYANFVNSIMKEHVNVTPSESVEQFYHMFDHTNVLTADEKRKLNRVFPDTLKAVHGFFGVDKPTPETIVGPEARKEMLANIYDQYVREGDKDVLKGIPQDTKDAIRKMGTFRERMAREIKRQKIISPDQLFAGLDAGLDQVRQERLKNVANEAAANGVYKDFLDSAALAQDEALNSAIDIQTNSGANKYNRAIGLWTGWKSSLQSLATKYPVAAEVIRVIDFRDQLRTMRQSELRKTNYKMADLEKSMYPGFMQQITERIHRLEEVNGSYDLSQPGIITLLDENGKPTSRIRNEKAYEGYQLADELKQNSLSMEEASYRANLKYFGIKDPNTSVDDLLRTVALAEGQNNLNKLTNGGESAEVGTRIETLKKVAKELKTIEQLKTKAFYPRTRSGSLGLAVYDSSKKLVHFEQFNENSRIAMKREANKGEIKHATDLIKAKFDDSHRVYGFDGKEYKPSELNEKVAPINLTRNSELRRHNVNSLVSAFDLLEDMGGLTKDSERLERLRDTLELRAQGNFSYFGDRRFIGGYEADPLRAAEMFSQRFSNHVTSREFAGRLKNMDKALSKYSDGTQADPVVKTVRERMQYALDPQESLAFLKSFNYMYAMGGSPKSAIVQLLQLFTIAQGNADSLNLSPLRNKKMTAHALREAGRFLSFKGGIPQIDIDNPNNVSKVFDQVSPKFLTPDQKKFFAKLTPTRHFESLQQKVFLEGQDAINKKLKTTGAASKVMSGIDKVLAPLNSLTGSAESLGRMANTLLFTEMFTNDPKALARYESQLGSNPKYRVFQEEYAKIGGDRAAIAALHMLDETFLVTGSTGKNKIATTGLMNALSPFANFATQLMGALNRQAVRDPRAFALGVMYTAMLGGVAGIPFYSNVKEMLNFMFTKLGGSPMDLDLEIRQAMYDLSGNAKIAAAVTKGIPEAYGGVDMSGSANQELPVVNNVLKLFTDPKISDVLSMPSSAIAGLASGAQQLGNLFDSDRKFDGAQFIQDVVPYKVIRDSAKAYQSATQPIKTQAGQPLLPAQSDDPMYVGLTAAGFIPSKRSEAQSKYWMQQLITENPKMTNFSQDRDGLFTDYYNTDDAQEKSDIQARIRKNVKEAAMEAHSQGIVFNTGSYIRDGITKGKQLVTGTRDPKRIPKRLRSQANEINQMFMVE